MFLLMPTNLVTGQVRSVKNIYEKALSQLDSMLSGTKPPSFKDAVFITENAYYTDCLKLEGYYNYIQIQLLFAENWMRTNRLKGYRAPDSVDVLKNLAIYKILTDTILLRYHSADSDSIKAYVSLPYKYDFKDFDGKQRWSNMFVSKLLDTHKGNCHSLPYLYKILADELRAQCWLSFAPNHIYIKNRCEQTGWYNTELTSGQFPIDAWITASGYISLDAIRNGIYMDTLSNQQAIAQCVLDLAKGYEKKTGNNADSFLVRCCDLVLQYHAANVGASIYKADVLHKQYEFAQKMKYPEADSIYKNMERLYVQIANTGYREMPEKMYKDWLMSVNKEAAKYKNREVPVKTGK
jgi:hypothetical protein